MLFFITCVAVVFFSLFLCHHSPPPLSPVRDLFVSHLAILNRTPFERMMHAILFEVIANILVFIILIAFSSAAPAQSGVLTLVSSAVAMAWNYFFNVLFDFAQQRTGFKKGLGVRSLHALLFETGLLLVLVPFAAWWLEITLLAAIRLETGLVLFFLAYTLVFNLVWDLARDRLYKSAG